MINVVVGDRFIRIGVGKMITISISKIKNKTASKKNRNEKGVRALEDEEKPHSKGLDVSRFFQEFHDEKFIK